MPTSGVTCADAAADSAVGFGGADPAQACEALGRDIRGADAPGGVNHGSFARDGR